ncbi:uncharacterized protein LOC6585930 [Drosophila mojavensis]|uniref:BTB domain-containing protein n=1 Tax=Drosophila mojavensis TaxID=7230 RepID=B4L7W9_DROMO|nr:uncharacterized protein LOC6585930 [Drosophila mojavensis]EDW05544.1 uncharacterized protein Dmoj_GI11092 [Drosophila mojavensis]
MDLDWQNSLTEIKDRGQYLLHSEKWADCRFLVGTPPNQRIISGHKLLLAMASPVFERMFYGNLPDKTDPIIIPDVQPEAFEAMLEYIYTDRITIGSFDKACELCYVAKKYMLPHVVTRCTHFLWADLSPKNACRAYEFAKLFDEPRLMQSSMDLIAANTREVLSDPSFLDIEVSTLMAILDQHRLNIDSELDLFNCLLKFASERGILNENGNEEAASGSGKSIACAEQAAAAANDMIEEIKMEPDVAAMVQHMHQDEDVESYKQPTGNGSAGSSPDHPAGSSCSSSTSNANANANASAAIVNDDVVIIDSDASGNANEEEMNAAEAAANMINMMDAQRTIMDGAMLRQAVKKIRFLTMTPQQFAEGPARSKLLKQHEALAILIKISSPTLNDCNMPEGFCVSRSTRNFYESAHRQRELSSSYRSANNPTNAANGFPGPATRTNQPLFTRQRISVPLNLGANAGAAAAATVDHIPAYGFSFEDEPLPMPNAAAFGDAYDGPPPPVAAAGAAAAAAAVAAPAAPPPGSDNDVIVASNSHHDMTRSYCMRSIARQFDYRNTSVTDCGVTFQVDTNIWILGVQVPTQVLCGELMNSAGFAERYTEVLYAHIQDMHGSRITYTHCTARVRYDSHLDITFDRPVYIYRNQIYKIYVVFNKMGWYPMYSCVPDTVRQRVKFMFNVGNPTESVRDGLIYAIIFSTPQDHARHLID